MIRDDFFISQYRQYGERVNVAISDPSKLIVYVKVSNLSFGLGQREREGERENGSEGAFDFDFALRLSINGHLERAAAGYSSQSADERQRGASKQKKGEKDAARKGSRGSRGRRRDRFLLPLWLSLILAAKTKRNFCAAGTRAATL